MKWLLEWGGGGTTPVEFCGGVGLLVGAAFFFITRPLAARLRSSDAFYEHPRWRGRHAALTFVVALFGGPGFASMLIAEYQAAAGLLAGFSVSVLILLVPRAPALGTPDREREDMWFQQHGLELLGSRYPEGMVIRPPSPLGADSEQV
tara:strand:- start:6045 stop:6488 length:444 start_codon:yes stop_codon:yes gene_type:complete